MKIARKRFNNIGELPPSYRRQAKLLIALSSAVLVLAVGGAEFTPTASTGVLGVAEFERVWVLPVAIGLFWLYAVSRLWMEGFPEWECFVVESTQNWDSEKLKSHHERDGAAVVHLNVKEPKKTVTNTFPMVRLESFNCVVFDYKMRCKPGKINRVDSALLGPYTSNHEIDDAMLAIVCVGFFGLCDVRGRHFWLSAFRSPYWWDALLPWAVAVPAAICLPALVV